MVGRKFLGSALVGAAAAQTAPPIPINAQAGLLNIPITCQILGFGNQTFNSQIKATAPIYGGTGQQVYYSDVAVDITVPTNIVNLVTLLGAKSANADLTVNLNIANGSPSTIEAIKARSANFSISLGKTGLISIPAQPPIGPITLGAAGSVQRITLGQISVGFNMYDSSGKTVLFPIPVFCNKQDVDFVIGSVAINSTTGLAPYKPSVGSALSFPSTPLGSESGGFHIPYDCVFGPLGNQNLDLTLAGTVPLYAAPGAPISLTNGQAFLKVPASVVHIAKIGWPSTAAFRTTISGLEINFNNASPATIQGASTPIVTTTNIGDGNSDVVIPIPSGSNLLTLGPVSAGQAGTIASFQVGTATAKTDLIDSAGNVLFSLDVTCKDPNALNLAGILVTNAKPGSYSFL